jgi:NitT/TauT family transport system substrate-binding protein
VSRVDRRHFLKGTVAVTLSVAGGALLAGCANQAAPFFARSGGARLETTTIRLPAGFATCVSPEFLAADLLRAEGFTDVKHVPNTDANLVPMVRAGDIDVAMQTAAITTAQADTDGAMVHLAGIHVGCFELFARDGIRSMSDLKGKRVVITSFDSGPHVHMAAMAAYVGLNPHQDITWVTDSPTHAMDAFADGHVDAFMAFPPEPQQLRKRGLSNVIVNTHVDRPWSQYFCCMLVANRAFVDNNPVAAKQAVRAILKSADLCARDPAGAAKRLVERGEVTDYDDALQTLSRDVSYDRWRDYDPEDTIRFYTLLLRQIGMVKPSPDKLIAQSTDWRILNELKRELKG